MVDHPPRYPSPDPDAESSAELSISHRLALYQAGRQARPSYSGRSAPLFVSDRDGAPNPDEYMASFMKGRGSYYASRILAGALGGIALAGLAALASSESARDFFASAKTSSVAAFSVASVAMQRSSTPSQTPDVQASESTQPPSVVVEVPVPASIASGSVASGSVVVAAATPTRDEIKTAYQGALKASAPQATAAAEQATPAKAIHHLDAGEIAALLKRAESLIGSGDLAAARLVLRRAAEAGDARAAMMLGGTYDPTVLEKLGVHGVVPDFAMARSWYEKAKRFGAPEATPQLDALAKKQN
jgi:TPR repeat protein